MTKQVGRIVMVLGLLLSYSLVCQAQAAVSPVSVPTGTTVDAIKYGPDDTPANLKPAEQVAFLFLYGMWALESDLADTSNGVGRLCTLAELVKGVKMPTGFSPRLSVDPAKDTLYRYDVTIIGDTCIIRALPRDRTLAGFAVVGAPKGFSHNFYFNPNGPDMTRALKITEMGYSGDGFILR